MLVADASAAVLVDYGEVMTRSGLEHLKKILSNNNNHDNNNNNNPEPSHSHTAYNYNWGAPCAWHFMVVVVEGRVSSGHDR